MLSVLASANLFPRSFEPTWLIGGALAILFLFVLNRWRVFATWPYVIVTVALWFTRHHAGWHGPLPGGLLAACCAYVVLPLFAFSATGVKLDLDLSTGGAPRILAGVVLGLVIGKPLGISLASWLAIKSGGALAPGGVSVRQFLGAACLC